MTQPPTSSKYTTSARANGQGRPLLAATGITVAIFCGLPYIERIGSTPARMVDLTLIDAVTLPPPPPPPLQPPERREDIEPPPPIPELTEQRRPIPLNVALDLDMALGGWRPGDFTPGFSLSLGGMAGSGGIYELSDLDTPPRALAQMRPLYPSRARARRIEGSVTLTFVVDADGTTRDIDVVAAQPAGVFEEAARRAAVRWRFSPGIRNGEPVPVRVRQTIRFQLDD